jgi:hypothetical protein
MRNAHLHQMQQRARRITWYRTGHLSRNCKGAPASAPAGSFGGVGLGWLGGVGLADVHLLAILDQFETMRSAVVRNPTEILKLQVE